MRRLLAITAILVIASASSAQDWAKAKLEKSPRHGEWVKVKAGKREVNSFIVYPEVKDKATAVVVIHEIFGLTDWVRTVADELAAAGYIAIAPDLLSGMAPDGGGSDKLGEGVRRVISTLPPDQITADLNGVCDYITKVPAANGQLAVAGFCWGGSQTFRFATNRKGLKASMAFYGTAPTNEADLAKIDSAVFGFYGGNDARVNATIGTTTAAMKKLDKKYEPVTYDGAGHGFLRAGAAPDASPENKKAHDAAWARIKVLLK